MKIKIWKYEEEITPQQLKIVGVVSVVWVGLLLTVGNKVVTVDPTVLLAIPVLLTVGIAYTTIKAMLSKEQ